MLLLPTLLTLSLLAQSAWSCSPSTGPVTGGGDTTAAPEASTAAATTASAAATTTATVAATTTADPAAAAYAKMDDKCKMAMKREYIVSDPANCAQNKLQCDLTQNQFCAYLQKSNADNSFNSNTQALKYACKLLPCACMAEIGKDGDTNCATAKSPISVQEEGGSSYGRR